MQRRNVALDGWVVLLTIVLCAPLFSGLGYPLAHDLVFTPRQPLTAESLGLGSLPPRAVPLDALVSLLERGLDGAIWARVLVPGALVVAGCGAHRLLRDLPFAARILVAGFAVWNPFVVERLALGQWALLWAYAALWWLVAAARHVRDGGPLFPVVGWLAVASITPSGGVIAAGTAVVLSRSWRVAAVAAVLQLPWILPSLLSAASVTGDPAGVDAFAARSERPGGAFWSLLGLGGIWDAGSVPITREGILGYLTTALVVVALVAGGGAVRRRFGTGLLVVGGTGLAVAVASTVPGLDELMHRVVDTVPGAGLLRDGQKWVMPFVVVVTLSLGEAAARLVRTWKASSQLATGVVVLAVLPVLLMPDAVANTWDTVTPTQYPADFEKADAAMDDDGDLAVLPWRSYRRFKWGRPVSVYDPASRWFDRTVVTSDALVVGDVQLAGESARARAIGRLLETGRPADVLGSAGITYVLAYRDDPAYDELDLSGLTPVYQGEHVEVLRVPGQVEPVDSVSRGSLLMVALVDLVVLLGALGWVCVGLAQRPLRRGTRVERK